MHRPPVRPAAASDRDELLRMRQALWPDSTAAEVDDLLRGKPAGTRVWVADRGQGGLCGFAEVGTRSFAEGCHTSPVAYLEGIWVDADARRGGAARALVLAAEQWARSRGFTEFASDCDVDNEPSQAFHEAVGFAEVARAICFRKTLERPEPPPAGSDDGGGSPKSLVIICGPGAVGKMTVGQALSDLTGLPLFHNHVSIEAVLPVFGFDSPHFNTLVAGFREAVFREAAVAEGPGLIFTFVWAFDHPGDLAFIRGLSEIFTDRGHRALFVELRADQEVRLRRNASASRLVAKPSKRDVARSAEALVEQDRRYQLNSSGTFPFPNHIVLDNTELSPEDAARTIVEHFDLDTLAIP